MVNSGLLEFKDAQKVRVDLNAETGDVVKAVKIDADDVETPIGGGGGGVLIINPTGETVSCANGGTAPVYDKSFNEVWNAFFNGVICLVKFEYQGAISHQMINVAGENPAGKELIIGDPNSGMFFGEDDEGRFAAKCPDGGGGDVSN